MVLAGSVLAAAALILAQALPGRALGQNVSVSVPRVSVPRVSVPRVSVEVPRISAPNVSVEGPRVDVPSISIDVPRITVPSVSVVIPRQAMAGVGRALGQVNHAVGPDLPNVPGVGLGHHIAANAAAAVAAVTSVTGPRSAGVHGLGALVAPGAIADHVHVRTGAITTASGTALTVDFYGDGLVNFAVDGPAGDEARGTPANGRGVAVVDGETITITAAAANSIVDAAVNMTGIVHSQAIASHGGQIALVAEAASVDHHAPISRQGRPDPLAVLLADAEFRPGGYALSAGVVYGQGPATRAEHAPPWSRDGATMHGIVPVGESMPPILVAPPPSDPVTLAEQPVDPGPDPEESELRANTVAMISRIESVVGSEKLASADVCQVAGGGEGQAGCNGNGRVEDLAALEPATGAGCTLTSGADGLRISCGGGAARPADPGTYDLPMPPIDSTTTLMDMMNIWLQRPVDPVSLPVALTMSDVLIAETSPRLDLSR